MLDVRPGITGLASLVYFQENELLGLSTDPHRTYVEQVMPAKLALDLEYVRRASLAYDLRLLVLTLARLLGMKVQADVR